MQDVGIVAVAGPLVLDCTNVINGHLFILPDDAEAEEADNVLPWLNVQVASDLAEHVQPLSEVA